MTMTSRWLCLGLLALMTGCEGTSTETETPTPRAPPEPVTTPDPAAADLPKPLMRTALHCCKNLTMEPVVRAYLEVGVALAGGDLVATAAAGTTLGEKLASLDVKPEVLEQLQAAHAGLTTEDLAAARTAYGSFSEVLIDAVRPSQSGTMDLAVAYSRDADAHWFQEGVQPSSPYGDDIASYSWGRREDVNAADEEREKELGNRP